MNKERFLIIDDDIGLCQILENIIEDHDLGEVIDLIHDGTSAIEMIPKYKPDIVFIDLLMPDIDGIEVVHQISQKNLDIEFIMISQVSDDDMITEAYDSGIEFYISKPINVKEVVTVTEKIAVSQRNRRMIEQIGQTINQNNQPTNQSKSDGSNQKIDRLFGDLGISAEKGASDIRVMILYALDQHLPVQVGDMYKHLGQYYETANIRKSTSKKAIEQRVRRTIQQALVNIAHLGIEDFGNFKFDTYASSLFSFQEVKKVMDQIRSDEAVKCTINIKHFISGCVNRIERQ